MSKKQSVYYPSYQLRPTNYRPRSSEIPFFLKHDGVYFVTKKPFFATETVKAVLDWASYSTPPVVFVSHEKPVASDRGGFSDPNELHRHYYPYAMSVATIACLGEVCSRIVKVYFCDVELHEENLHATKHERYKGAYVMAI